MLGDGSVGGISERAVRGTAAVYACAAVLCDGMATLPIRQFRGRGPNRSEMDLSPVIYDPWPECTDVDFRVQGQWGLAIRGNFIGRVVERDKQKTPTMIQPLENDGVDVTRNSKTGQLEYKIRHAGGTVIPADDVFHIRNIVRPGAFMGLSPVEELRLTWRMASGADAYAANFYANSAIPAGVIETSEDLSEEETIALGRAWLMTHQGISGAHLPAVLTGGATWREVAMNFQDAQFIQSRQLSWSEISMIFRIPPHMISVVDRTTSWGTGIEQQETGFVRNTLGGYIRRWEVALSRCLPAGQYVEIDLRKRLRGDSVQRAAIIVSLVNAGVINRNEARTLYEDLPPAGAQLDTFLQPLNMGDAGMFMPPPVPKGSTSAPSLHQSRSLAELEPLVDDVHRLLALQGTNGNG